MKELLSGIQTWSWFSDEKGLNFNGHFITKGDTRLLIDPPPLADADVNALLVLGVTAIVLTNRDHTRMAGAYRDLFKCPIFAPALDATEMKAHIAVDHLYHDGEILPGEILVVGIPDGKSPGESALYLGEQGIFIVGDALIGKPVGSLTMLPPDKFPNYLKAKEGIRRLLDYPFESVLVGDGDPMLTGARMAVEVFLNAG